MNSLKIICSAKYHQMRTNYDSSTAVRQLSKHSAQQSEQYQVLRRPERRGLAERASVTAEVLRPEV